MQIFKQAQSIAIQNTKLLKVLIIQELTALELIDS
jgi:hypothetical protein